jgi:uncharacterized protein YcnI
LAHIEVVPEESVTATVERYGMRVPSEKAIPTTRIEVQFPREIRVIDLELVDGWRVTTQKDGSGRIVSAVWEGGSIPEEQFEEFGLRARNPEATADLTWQVIQTYQDGSEVQWIGPPNAEFPAALTRVRPAGAGLSGEALVTGLPGLVGLAAIIISGLAWRAASPRATRTASK